MYSIHNCVVVHILSGAVTLGAYVGISSTLFGGREHAWAFLVFVCCWNGIYMFVGPTYLWLSTVYRGSFWHRFGGSSGFSLFVLLVHIGQMFGDI